MRAMVMPHPENLSVSNSTRRYRYFTQFTWSKGFLYLLSLLYVFIVTILSILQPFFLDVCKEHAETLDLNFENPGYDQRICKRTRARALLYLTPEECGFGRRIIIAAFLGGLIGWERRNADRPAGIRTMSLVSLGACLFSICSAFAFLEGPMNWDGSRVAAAIPSGVGFLGAAVIWKQVNKEQDGHTVHGLTTAASVWLSAAVGIACSGELYFAATFAVSIMLLMLRFGPRMFMFDEDEDEDEDDDEGVEANVAPRRPRSYSSTKTTTFIDIPTAASELLPLTSLPSTGSLVAGSPSFRSAMRRNTAQKPSLME